MRSKVSYYILVVIIIVSGSFVATAAGTPSEDANGQVLEAIILVIVAFLILVLAVSRIWKYGEPEEN
jgi:hypothetical protein